MSMERSAEMESKYTSRKFYAMLAAIESEELRVRVEDSAIANAGDTMIEQGRKGHDGPDFWEMAISTARMILDCPKDYYPELY
jgi:hypothetical protein